MIESSSLLAHLPPGFLLILGALLVPLLPARLRKIWMVMLPAAGLAHVIALPDALSVTWAFGETTLELVRVDKLSRIFGIIFHIAALIAVIFALHLRNTPRDIGQQVAALAYAGAAIAAVFAGDLVTLFIMWELTAITSVFLVWARGTERSYKAGMRYLIVQVGSGVLLLAGIAVRYHTLGNLDFGHIGLDGPGGTLILLSFGIKAAFPFLHNWLQDAYPESTETGVVFLASFTTKLAIYALARGFAGTEILVPIGTAMAVFPIFYAVLENDLRRVLAYSLNNQLGFMIVGVGIGTDLAINGACAHAFAHIIYKGLLFMSMGAVLYRTGTTKASELGGLYKSMPWTTAFCMVGSASISAFPFLSGFAAKSLIIAAVIEQQRPVVFGMLLFASAGVVDHSGIKVPFFAFFAHDNGWRVKEAPKNMLVAMGMASALCIGIGVYPWPLYDLLPHAIEYNPFHLDHVLTQAQLLLFAALAFGVLMRTGLYPAEVPSVNLDTDWTYRKAFPAVIRATTRGLGTARQTMWSGTMHGLRRLQDHLARTYSPQGALGEPWPTGKTALWAAALLVLFLVLEASR